ncbi:PASTA domain-containing protein, partial [Escherichia coli]
YETVRNWLVTQGFNINNISATYDYSDTVPSGSIISQDPASGEVVAEETYISFVVSQGTEPKLNDISGYTKSEAQSYLASIGAEYIGHETSEYSSTVDKDKV